MRRILALAALVVSVTVCQAADPPAAGPVLDLEAGSFRAFVAWKTPVLVAPDGALKPLLEPRRKDLNEEDRQPVKVRQSAPPPAGWTDADFDDSAWSRVRGPVAVNAWGSGSCCGPCDLYTPGNPAEWNLVCLRGKFVVADPAQVGELKLSLGYYGGAVVTVNGKELHRGHLPAGKLEPTASADRYGEEAYLRPDGQLYREGDERTLADRLKARVRQIPPKDGPAGVTIPASMLRKGVNVVAIEVRAAPVDERAVAGGAAEGGPWRGALVAWPHAGVVEATVSSASGTGLAGNVAPAAGIAISNSDPLESVFVFDYAHPADQVRPIRIVGVRNGSFSGKVVVSSAGTIRKLTAACSELAQAGEAGRIPAAAVAVRWAEAVSQPVGWGRPERFDRLLDQFPAEIAPARLTLRNRKVQPAPAAVAPIWVTVRVPADAAPGDYAGTLTIQAEAGGVPARFAVPVQLKVHDWKLADPKEFASHHNIYQSPDTVAQYYKVPLWSDRHFELMGKSLDALSQLGSKICVVKLIVKTPTLNNTESMVRWVRKGDGYEYDFTVLDKYLDLYAARAGKPAILQLNIWTHPGRDDKNPTPPHGVSVLDPATGKLEATPQPAYGTAENEAFWRPVLTELRKRLEDRGWFDVAAVCYTSYCWAPSKEVVGVFKSIWPDGRWMNCSHSNPSSYVGAEGSMPVPYSEWVWGCGGLYNPDAAKTPGRLFPRPWKKGTARIEVGNPRFGVGFIYGLYDRSPLAAFRTVTEAAMQGNIRGLGRVGGDFWPLQMGKEGRYESLCDAYGAVGPSNNTKALISPGPDGAVFNERAEMFREGVQVAEAIIFLQQALEAKRVGDELARRIDDLLDERARAYLRTRPGQDANWLSLESAGWQERDDRLFALAAEVARGSK